MGRTDGWMDGMGGSHVVTRYFKITYTEGAAGKILIEQLEPLNEDFPGFRELRLNCSVNPGQSLWGSSVHSQIYHPAAWVLWENTVGKRASAYTDTKLDLETISMHPS